MRLLKQFLCSLGLHNWSRWITVSYDQRFKLVDFWRFCHWCKKEEIRLTK